MDYDVLLTPYPIVYVSINNHTPLPFMLDTGTDFSLWITRHAAEEIGLNISYKRVAKIKSSGTLLPLISVANLAFVSAYGKQQKFTHLVPKCRDAVVFDWPERGSIVTGKPLAGLIGTDMFANDTIRMDFDTHILTIFPHAPSVPIPSTAIILPLKKKNKRIYMTLSDSQNHGVDALLDTGASTVNISVKQVELFPLLKTAHQELRATTDGIHNVHVALLPQLHIGNLVVPDVIVVYPTDAKNTDENKLGMNVLSRYRLTIDFAHQKLMLEPAVHAAARSRLPGLPVVNIVRRKRHIFVRQVQFGSAPYRVGLQAGDQIIAVDHTLMRQLPETAAQAVIDGYGNTQAELVVRRRKHKYYFHYLRYSFSVAAQHMDSGMQLRMTSHNRLQVETVHKGSPAEQAGLMGGDAILRVGMFSVEKTDYERLLSILNNPKTDSLLITIKHKRESEPKKVLLQWQ